MFNVSDKELDGLEAKAGPSADAQAFRPMPFGADDGGGGMPPPMPPLPAEPLPVMMQTIPPSDQAAASGAGKALALVTVGLVAGAIAGGAWGAGAGVALVGAGRNLFRVKQLWGSPNAEDRSEAGKSATLGIMGLGVAGLLVYQAYQHKTEGASPFHDDD